MEPFSEEELERAGQDLQKQPRFDDWTLGVSAQAELNRYKAAFGPLYDRAVQDAKNLNTLTEQAEKEVHNG